MVEHVRIDARLRFRRRSDGAEAEGVVTQIGSRRLANGAYVPGWVVVDVDGEGPVVVDQADMIEVVSTPATEGF